MIHAMGRKSDYWWARQDLNLGPRDYEENELQLIDSERLRSVRAFLFALPKADPDRPYTEPVVGRFRTGCG